MSSISSADEIRIGVTGRGLLVLDGNSFVVTTAEPHTLKVIEVVKRRWSLAVSILLLVSSSYLMNNRLSVDVGF